jgi:hypothetical protein
MALFFECMLLCAQKLLDTADIVREAIFRQLNLSRRRSFPLKVGPIGPWSIALNFAGEVRSVVGTAAAVVGSLLRIWAKGASHVDDAIFVDSGGGVRFWGLVLFAPAFEHSDPRYC